MGRRSGGHHHTTNPSTSNRPTQESETQHHNPQTSGDSSNGQHHVTTASPLANSHQDYLPEQVIGSSDLLGQHGTIAGPPLENAHPNHLPEQDVGIGEQLGQHGTSAGPPLENSHPNHLPEQDVSTGERFRHYGSPADPVANSHHHPPPEHGSDAHSGHGGISDETKGHLGDIGWGAADSLVQGGIGLGLDALGNSVSPNQSVNYGPDAQEGDQESGNQNGDEDPDMAPLNDQDPNQLQDMSNQGYDGSDLYPQSDPGFATGEAQLDGGNADDDFAGGDDDHIMPQQFGHGPVVFPHSGGGQNGDGDTGLEDGMMDHWNLQDHGPNAGADHNTDHWANDANPTSDHWHGLVY